MHGDMAESRTLGVFNATGPNQALTMGGMLTEIGQGIGIVPQLVWAPTAFLMKTKFRPGATCLSGYLVRRETFGFHRREIYQTIAADLTYRPLPLTAGNTLD